MSEDPRPSRAYLSYLAGVASGITKSLVGHPFDTVKLRMQTEETGRFRGPFDCLIKTVKFEGMRGLYKGVTPPLFGWMIMDSVMLGTFSLLKNNIRILFPEFNRNDRLIYWQNAVSGIGAGWAVSIVATPIELVKAKLQIQYDKNTTRFTGPIACAQSIFKSEGVCGLWRGLRANLMFRGLLFIFWSSYEYYSRLITAKLDSLNLGTDSDILVPFLAGGFAANTFWVIAFPFDVVKNRIMSSNEPRLGIIETIDNMKMKGGLRAFYRGYLPALLRSFPTNGAALLSYELVKRYIE